MVEDASRCGFIGYIEVVDPSTMVAKQPTSSNKLSTTNYSTITMAKNYDKQSGIYMRGTAKESYSSGDYTNRGKVGYKDEYKASSTVRVGDKRGYTEYYKEEKVTRVEYDNDGSSYSGGNAGYYGGGGGGRKMYKGRYGGGKKKYLY